MSRQPLFLIIQELRKPKPQLPLIRGEHVVDISQLQLARTAAQGLLSLCNRKGPDLLCRNVPENALKNDGIFTKKYEKAAKVALQATLTTLSLKIHLAEMERFELSRRF